MSIEEPVNLPDLAQELNEARAALADRDATITQLERRMQIDELLREADAIDLESARLLTEMAVASMDTPDVEAAVADLRSRKPRLFRVPDLRAFAQSAVEDGAADEPVAQAAADAHATGHRRDLLRYLRLRRETRR